MNVENAHKLLYQGKIDFKPYSNKTGEIFTIDLVQNTYQDMFYCMIFSIYLSGFCFVKFKNFYSFILSKNINEVFCESLK